MKPDEGNTGVEKELTKDGFFKLIGAGEHIAIPNIIWDTLEHHGYTISKQNAALIAALKELTLTLESVVKDVNNFCWPDTEYLRSAIERTKTLTQPEDLKQFP